LQQCSPNPLAGFEGHFEAGKRERKRKEGRGKGKERKAWEKTPRNKFLVTVLTAVKCRCGFAKMTQNKVRYR